MANGKRCVYKPCILRAKAGWSHDGGWLSLFHGDNIREAVSERQSKSEFGDRGIKRGARL